MVKLMFIGLVLLMPTDELVINEPQVTQEVARSSFHKAVVKAVRNQRKAGKITGAQSLAIQARMLSPFFRKTVKNVFVTQMMANEEAQDWFPRTDDGKINTADIDWQSLIEQIEKWISIIVQILELFNQEFTFIPSDWQVTQYKLVA